MAAFPLNLTLGPIVIGAFISVLFFGVICMQTINYLKKFPNDIVLVKCVVIFLWFLQLAYTACICQGAYTMSVTDFGSIFSLLFTPWGLNLAVVIGEIIDHVVQAFFVARIYRATGVFSLSIFLWLMVAFLQGVSLKLVVEAIRTDSIPVSVEKWRWLLELLFFGDAALDVVNACVLCFYLKVQSRSAFSQSTAALLNRLVVYTLQTGLATSFVALVAAISFKLAPEDYIWTCFFMAMPGSFMSALLVNINNRRSLSQPGSTLTNSAAGNIHSVNQGATMQFSTNIVLSRDEDQTGSPVKLDAHVPSGSIELAKISARPGIYGTNTV
ncbi:hypothetical protein C8R44DRAFT_756690 [Mycena epipterygia]|nr:hypothetical protein C8R44DRAFT_756690 [Mycena epipterygia]